MKIFTKVLLHISAWVLAEVFLTVVGLDNLADYTEFVFTTERPTTEVFANYSARLASQ